jgi:anti-sigma B factor antagonist
MPAYHDEALRIEPVADSGGRLFRLTGYLDLSTVDLLRETVGPACGSGEDVRLDLSGLTFCDSTGVGALVWLYRRASAGAGRLVVYAPRKAVRDVLRISGVDRVIPVLGADALPVREARTAGGPDAAPA